VESVELSGTQAKRATAAVLADVAEIAGAAAEAAGANGNVGTVMQLGFRGFIEQGVEILGLSVFGGRGALGTSVPAGIPPLKICGAIGETGICIF
jgi:hypothetical protein